MKNGKIPTRRRRDIIRSCGLNLDEYLVVKNMEKYLELVRRIDLKKREGYWEEGQDEKNIFGTGGIKMQILIDISECDRQTIQRWIMDSDNVITNYMKKQESHGALTDEEGRRFCEWKLLRGLLQNILREYYAQGMRDAKPIPERELKASGASLDGKEGGTG